MKQSHKLGLVWQLVLSLFISVSASAIALSSRIRYYTAMVDVNSMIPLVPESVTMEELQAAAAKHAAKATKTSFTLDDAIRASRLRYSTASLTHNAPARPVRLNQPTLEPFFSVSDDNTVWGTNTQVDIFKTSYENGQGKITVASGNGDKIIAPGTENSYTFKLKNNFHVPMDYTVQVRAWCSPDGIDIPVICRLSRYDGTWIAGGENRWLTVEDFDGAEDTAILSEASYVSYTLDWQWPFVGDDDIDTLLANLVTQQDISLTIEIITLASPIYEPGNPGNGGDIVITPDPEPEPEIPIIPIHPEPEEPEIIIPDEPVPEKPEVGVELPPKTGDDSHPVLWICIAAVSLILLLILLFWTDKEKKDNNTEAKNREQSKQPQKG